MITNIIIRLYYWFMLLDYTIKRLKQLFGYSTNDKVSF